MYIYISCIYIYHIYIYNYYYYYYIIIIFHLKDWFPWPISVHGTRKGKGYCPAALAEMSTVSSGDGLLGPIRDERPGFGTRVRRATGWKQSENIIKTYKKRDKAWLDGW